MNISFNTAQNLKQIDSLKSARIKSDFNQNLLNKRIAICKREIVELRRFGSLKKGKVQDYVFELANWLETQLNKR